MSTQTDEVPPTTSREVDTTEADQPAGAEAEVEAMSQELEVAPLPAVPETHLVEVPIMPRHDEFMALAAQAKIMAASALVPRALQNRPADVLLVMLTGRDVGVPITAALRKCYVIDGQVTVAPALRLAKIRNLGLGRIVPDKGNDDTRAAAIAVDPRDRPMGPPSVFTWDDAARAGLVDPRCTATEHFRPSVGNGRCNCKDNWRKYPQRMLWWRAAGYCADDYFPEAGLGLYSPDELGAVTDELGQPIDVNEVEVPEWVPASGNRQRSSALSEASEDAKADVQHRIEGLKPSQREWLKGEWMRREIRPVARLNTADVVVVHALINTAAARPVEAEDESQAPPGEPHADEAPQDAQEQPSERQSVPERPSQASADESSNDSVPDDRTAAQKRLDTQIEDLRDLELDALIEALRAMTKAKLTALCKRLELPTSDNLDAMRRDLGFALVGPDDTPTTDDDDREDGYQ